LHDEFSWKVPQTPSASTEWSKAGSATVEEGSVLRYIGGVDLSFSKTDSSTALGALVVIDMQSMKVVYEDFELVRLDMPYIPGFLAFREVRTLPFRPFLLTGRVSCPPVL
jgi:deoxyinosine 3'endonuclease (endonuclease V)